MALQPPTSSSKFVMTFFLAPFEAFSNKFGMVRFPNCNEWLPHTVLVANHSLCATLPNAKFRVHRVLCSFLPNNSLS